jgi:hypothetical protein
MTLPAVKLRQDRLKKGSHRRRRLRRAERRVSSTTSDAEVVPPRPKVLEKYVLKSKPRLTGLEAEELPVASTGYIALRDEAKPIVIGLEALRSDPNMSIIDWDGMCVLNQFYLSAFLKNYCSSATPIVDKEGRVIAVLAGSPSDPGWAELQRSAAFKLEECRKLCKFTGKLADNRQGDFPALAQGISFGGGQTIPKNLNNSRTNKNVLTYLNSQDEFKRIAGFASGMCPFLK